MNSRSFLCIDLKSFYASVECRERNVDPLTTNLVVADPSRTEKTICLAVTPSLKAHGISGRARLFEVIQRVKEVNDRRLKRAISLGVARKDENGVYQFSGSSVDAGALEADPSLELAYYIAPPRMKLYEEYSSRIVSIYTRYVSPEDIIVYSIDEIFADITQYLRTYGMTEREFAQTMIRDVLFETGITATAGIGTNPYLAKICMDIVAKHAKPDENGVRIAQLDERSYREKLWCHTPLTDFWRVGYGTAGRLARLNCHTMGDVARLSLRNEDLLYKTFGINAELLIDHAWGRESVDMKTIKSYTPESNSLSSGQVLSRPYEYDEAKLIVREMTELLAQDLVRRKNVTRKLTLTISYHRASLQPVYEGKTIKDSTFKVSRTGEIYQGTVTPDFYGRPHPEHAHGTGNLDRWTNSGRRIMAVMMDLFERIVDPDLLVHRVNITAADLIRETEIPESRPVQYNLFVDYDALEEEDRKADEKERRIQNAAIMLQAKYGKNAVLKGMNLLEGGTTISRNGQIGGHRAGGAPSQRHRKKETGKDDEAEP